MCMYIHLHVSMYVSMQVCVETDLYYARLIKKEYKLCVDFVNVN